MKKWRKILMLFALANGVQFSAETIREILA
jgi:hypothetical protein